MAAKKTGAKKSAAKKVTTRQPRESVKKTTTTPMTDRTQDAAPIDTTPSYSTALAARVNAAIDNPATAAQSNITNVARYVEPQGNPPSSYPHEVRPETRVIRPRESERKERREK